MLLTRLIDGNSHIDSVLCASFIYSSTPQDKQTRPMGLTGRSAQRLITC